MAAIKKRGKPYTARQIDFLRKHYPTMIVSELTAAFNRHFRQDRSVKAIRSTLKRENITCGNDKRKPGYRGTLLTEQQVHWLKRWYVRMEAREVVERLNAKFDIGLTLRQFKAFVKNHNITCGRTGQFEKGTVPANKGLRRPGWGPGRMKETQFKPGHTLNEVHEIGHERIGMDGYIWIKTPQVNPYTGAWGHYMPKHQWIWQQANGPQPKNMVVTFIDGDRMNCVLENLELISRGENARRNKMKISEADPDTRESIKLIAKLQHTLGEKRRRQEKA